MLLRLVIAGVVLAHGVGHVLFLGPALRVVDWAGQSSRSWLLTATLGDGASRAIAAVVWSTAIVLFVGGVAGYLTDAPWWRTATIVAAIVSLAGIVVFWDGLAMPSVVFALIVDLAILAALVIAHWPAGAEIPA
jgi:hypothetical protein